MTETNALIETLQELWAAPLRRQARQLDLRRRHTVLLTGQFESIEAWAIPLLAGYITSSAGYFQTPALLDAGCGSGYYLEHLAPLLPTSPLSALVGLDLSYQALMEAKSRLITSQALAGLPAKSAALVQSSLLNLPFRPATFGAVMCNRMLNQTGAIALALGQAARALSPGGSLLVLTAFSLPASPLRVAHENAMQQLGFPARFYSHNTPPGQSFDLQNGAGWLSACFEDISIELYERRLEFYELAPLVEYYASGLLFQKSAGLDEAAIPLQQWARLYELMQNSLAHQLAASCPLVISDGAALFHARLPEK